MERPTLHQPLENAGPGETVQPFYPLGRWRSPGDTGSARRERGNSKAVQKPFRCVACGALSAAATRCEACGASAFELARPPTPGAVPQPELADLVSLSEVRAEREARERPPSSD